MDSKTGLAPVIVERSFTVQWGECDPLGIIFYPTYFRWIDSSSHALFATVGHDMRTLRETFGLEGPVIVDAGARFLRPVTYGDEILARAWISEWNDKTFKVDHIFEHDGRTICSGHEVRAWAVPDEASPTGIKATSIPQTFRRLFQA